MRMALWAVMTPEHIRLGALIKQRREAMGIYTVVDAARRSGLTRETWAKVERGESAKPVTYRKIEDLLNWMPGSCRSVLAGGEPHGELINPAQPEITPRSDELAEIDAALDAMRAAIAELERIKRARRAG
jgi:transcriptional regulator with XRE-family HTH domain